MVRWLKRIIFSKWAVAVGILVAAWQGWQILRPKPWAPNELQTGVAEKVCWQAAEALPPGLPGVEKIAVVRLGGRDTDGYVSKKLAECIHRTGRYDILHETFVGNLMRELGIDEKPVSTLAEAVEAGKGMGVSAIVFGEVPEFTSNPTHAIMRLNLRVARVQQGDAVFAESFDGREPPSPASVAGVRHSVRASSVLKRILIWLAIAALLPLLLIPAIKHFLERESNAVNFALLAALTLTDLALAFVLVGLTAFSWLPALLLVLASVAGGFYNHWVCSTIERLRK